MRMIGVYLSADGLSYDLRRDASNGSHLEQDASLRTSVLVLLFTEARLNVEDVRPGEPRGGWWGNSYPDVPGWELGSRLHLLAHGKATSETLRLIEQEIRTRLQCLIDDGIARAIDVLIERNGRERWDARVGIVRRDGVTQWIPLWEATI